MLPCYHSENEMGTVIRHNLWSKLASRACSSNQDTHCCFKPHLVISSSQPVFSCRAQTDSSLPSRPKRVQTPPPTGVKSKFLFLQWPPQSHQRNTTGFQQPSLIRLCVWPAPEREKGWGMGGATLSKILRRASRSSHKSPPNTGSQFKGTHLNGGI